jgi:ATP-dependent Clp protease ATP-binding subunit ClpB
MSTCQVIYHREKLYDIKEAKSRLESARLELEQAQRKGDLTTAGRLKYGIIPELELKVAPTE